MTKLYYFQKLDMYLFIFSFISSRKNQYFKLIKSLKSWKEDLCAWSAIWVEIDSKKGILFQSYNISPGPLKAHMYIKFTGTYTEKAIRLKILTMKVLENLIDKFDSQNGIFFMNILWKRKCVKKNHNQIQHIVIQFDFVKTEEKGVFLKRFCRKHGQSQFFMDSYTFLPFTWIRLNSTYVLR